MGAAARIAFVLLVVSGLGLGGCKLDTEQILAADALIEHVNTGVSEDGSVGGRVATGLSLGPDASTRVYYQFVDSRGQVRFVDRLGDIPPEWRDRVGYVELDAPPPLTPMDARQARTTRVAAAGGSGRIIFYTAEWCPWCRKAQDHMDRVGIDYDPRDVDDPAIMAELVEKTGQQGVPVFDVGGRILTGFDPDGLDKLVGI